jgi:hypothetical protein
MAKQYENTPKMVNQSIHPIATLRMISALCVAKNSSLGGSHYETQ